MKLVFKFFNCFLLLTILSSCAEGEFFGPKKPPLKGERLNVLHYDLLKDRELIKEKITLPMQVDIPSWNFSDIGQFTGLPSHLSLPDDLTKKSYFNLLNFNKSSGSALLIVGDIIFTYSGNTLTSYNSTTKRIIWSVKTVLTKEKNDILSGSMTYDNNIIYLASGVNDLIAYNASNGKELWRYKAPNVTRHISLVHKDKLYFSSTDNNISCLDLNGKLLWRYEAPIYSLATNRLYIPSIVYNDKIINITTAGDLLVLNRYDGSELTQVNLATSSIIGDGSLAKGPLASPVLNGDYLYILTGESEFIKIDLAAPQIAWRKNFPNVKSFWVADRITYMLTKDNQLFAIDNHEGKMLWIETLTTGKNKKISTEFYGPILAGNKLILTSRIGEIILISPFNGKEIKRYNTYYSTHQMPIIANNKLYFIGVNGNISVWH